MDERCAHIRETLGGYVLGALDPQEYAEVRAHLEQCPRCRAEHDELTTVPPLLELLTPEEVENGAPAPSDSGLRAVLSRVRTQRARDVRRRRIRFLVAAAALVAMATAGAWGIASWQLPPQVTEVTAEPGAGLSNSRGDGSTTAPSDGPTATATPQRWSARGTPNTHHAAVSATVVLNPVAWGTKLDVSLRGVAKDEICSMVVVDKTGEEWQAGSWRTTYGDVQTWSGGIGLKADEVDKIEVYAHGYRRVVTLDG